MIPGLTSVAPVALRLPAVYQEDDLLQRFATAFDEALAPLFLTLDTLECYVDPGLAPPDFLDWLAEWVGVEVDDVWSVQRRREVVAGAARSYRRRGTAAGVAEALRLMVDGRVSVEESGASAWSDVPGGALPGSPQCQLLVTVHVADPGSVDRARLDRMIAAISPAHVPHTLDIREDPDADLR